MRRLGSVVVTISIGATISIFAACSATSSPQQQADAGDASSGSEHDGGVVDAADAAPTDTTCGAAGQSCNPNAPPEFCCTGLCEVTDAGVGTCRGHDGDLCTTSDECATGSVCQSDDAGVGRCVASPADGG